MEREQKIQFTRGQNAEKLFAQERLLRRLDQILLKRFPLHPSHFWFPVSETFKPVGFHTIIPTDLIFYQTVLIAQMQQLPSKTQQRFSVFGTCFDVSNIIISHYQCVEKIYRTIGIYNYSHTMSLSTKLSTMFSPKDFVPDSLKSHVVYQFTCASCGALCIGETNRHFNTRVNEHLFRDKNPTSSNISALQKTAGISVIFLVLRFSIMLALILNLK